MRARSSTKRVFQSQLGCKKSLYESNLVSFGVSELAQRDARRLGTRPVTYKARALQREAGTYCRGCGPVVFTAREAYACGRTGGVGGVWETLKRTTTP